MTEKIDLAKLSRLARLYLTPDEITKFEGDLGRIVSFVAQLNEVDVNNVKPMSHAGERFLSLREDKPKETAGRLCIKSSAGYEDGLVRVPKIVE